MDHGKTSVYTGSSVPLTAFPNDTRRIAALAVHTIQFDTCWFPALSSSYYQALSLLPGSFRANCDKLNQPSSKNRKTTGVCVWDLPIDRANRRIVLLERWLTV